MVPLSVLRVPQDAFPIFKILTVGKVQEVSVVGVDELKDAELSFNLIATAILLKELSVIVEPPTTN